MQAGSIAHVQSVRMDTAEMKYETFVITEASAHIPSLGFHVAEIGRHQVSTAISVTIQAIVASIMTVYKIHRTILLLVILSKATQIDALIGTVDRT